MKWSFEYLSRTSALKDAKLPDGLFGFMFEGMQSVDTPDLDSSLSLVVLPTGAFNYMSIDDPKVNSLLSAQRKEVDVARRREILRQIVRQLNETGTAIPLWQRAQYIFTQPAIQGWYHQADYHTIGSVWNTWINK